MTYNQESFIGKCLASLLSQNTSFPFEIIVSDDASTDGTWQVISALAEQHPTALKAFRQPKNLGPTQNLLSTHNKATGTYVAHLDGDDYALPGKLQALADFLDQNPDCNIVWHRMVIYSDNSHAAIGMPLVSPKLLFGSNKIGVRTMLLSYAATGCQSGSAYRRAARTVFTRDAETLDYYFTISLCLGGGMAGYIDEALGVYRYFASVQTVTRTPGNRRVHAAKIGHLKEFLQRYPEYRREICAHACMEWLKLSRLGFPDALQYWRIAWSTRTVPRVRDLRLIWKLIQASRHTNLQKVMQPVRPEWL